MQQGTETRDSHKKLMVIVLDIGDLGASLVFTSQLYSPSSVLVLLGSENVSFDAPNIWIWFLYHR